ncbi:DUF3501 family protein [Exilibacterium tricleocarpae]|uniref:DUF3501 family protein n=1 Tax=Exilibacterium tricleocarpae TaxID=2591008 RepID=A0A545TNA1_9GAMM|nr:DUF3501 family protein [Exilibacterium tricleocarpae]TQV78694.1 DUF3501 family protein [Exilibacterium tricleocarpae]
MTSLNRSDLWSLEEYAERRAQFREQVMAHKKQRQVVIGNHARLLFEDELSIRYQVQEMLRIEKVFEAEGIQDELDAYNPLIPDGQNWKATLMLEYDDVDERRRRLATLRGIEDTVWLRIEDFDKVFPICNEDLERSNEEKTSSVHFLRFELTPAMVQAVKQGARLQAGIDHPGFDNEPVALSDAVTASLANDLDDISLN